MLKILQARLQQYLNHELPDVEAGNVRLEEISGFPGGSDSKECACNAGELGSIPGSGRSAGEGNGNPLQY